MSKVRVYELAKEFGVESKVILAKLADLGEFVRSASSTVEPPVIRKLREAMPPPVAAATAAPAKKTAKKAAAKPATVEADDSAGGSAAEPAMKTEPEAPKRSTARA